MFSPFSISESSLLTHGLIRDAIREAKRQARIEVAAPICIERRLDSVAIGLSQTISPAGGGGAGGAVGFLAIITGGQQLANGVNQATWQAAYFSASQGGMEPIQPAQAQPPVAYDDNNQPIGIYSGLFEWISSLQPGGQNDFFAAPWAEGGNPPAGANLDGFDTAQGSEHAIITMA